MKKYLIPALALGLVMTSCQSDEPFAPGEGGEKQVTFTLNVPGELGTRAGEAYNSGVGGLSNNAGELSYTLVLDADGDQRKFTKTGAGSVVFNPTVVLGREYTVTAYAHFGEAWDGATAIDITKHFNDETKDAYFQQENIKFQLNKTNKQITLKRPFGKLRLLATDYIADGNQLNTAVKNVKITYNDAQAAKFDVFDSEFEFDGNYVNADAKTFGYYAAEDGAMPIFADYVPANPGDNMVDFTVEVTYTNGETYSRTFNDIPVKRNALTTLKGNFFTAGAEITVNVEDNFDNFIPGEGNAEEQLRMAIAMGGSYTLQSDVTLSKPLQIGANMVLDLNGKTITAANAKGVGAVIEVAEGVSAKLVGGTIKSTKENGDAAINNAGELVLDDISIEGAPIADGGYPNYAVYTSGKLVVEEGTTITSDRGALYMSNGADVTINGGNISVTDALGTRALTAHVIYAYGSTSKLTINDGNFALNYNAAEGLGASVICPAGATIKVFDGDFRYYGVQGGQSGIFQNYMGYGAPVDVYGGTFNDNTVTKSGNIAAGYKAVENGGKYYVVPEASAIATTESEFKEALANSGNVVLLSNINIDKINLTNVTSDVVIDANGYTITTTDSYGIEATAGKNITIKNATIGITKYGDYITYAAGLKIANGDYADKTIKLENCVIRMANTDWAYAVNMPASVKNLNLVLDKCELEGAVAVQCWGDNNKIDITNSKLICNYTTSAQYTSYCVALQGDAYNKSENNKLTIANCEFLYSGVDNFNSSIYAIGNEGLNNIISTTNCAYGDKIVY